MTSFRRLRTLQMLSICSTGCLKVLFYFYLSRLTKKSYQTFIQNDIRQRAIKLLKTAKSTYSLSTVINANDLSQLQHRPCIYMSNHLSILDIPLIYSLIPGKIKFIAKQSLFKLPIFGKAIHTAGIISVDHENLFDHLKSIVLSKESHASIWIFPEGHRTLDGKLLNFKAGGFALARELKAVIIPVGIIGTNNVLPAKSLNLHPHLPTELKIGTPIDCLDYQKPEQLIDLIHSVRSSISELICPNSSPCTI
jgi:1-acyl-sn-glycerol-3-phosphate acyltransferase